MLPLERLCTNKPVFGLEKQFYKHKPFSQIIFLFKIIQNLREGCEGSERLNRILSHAEKFSQELHLYHSLAREFQELFQFSQPHIFNYFLNKKIFSAQKIRRHDRQIIEEG